MRKIMTNSALVLVLGLTGGIGCKRNEEGSAPSSAALAQSGQSPSGSSPASGSMGTGSGTSSGKPSSATGTGGPSSGSGAEMGNGNGQTSGTTGGSATGQPSGGMGAGQGAAMELRTPEQVLTAVHMINMMEIESGQLAQRKGSSEQVKKLGATLVKDHQAADKKVMALAKKQKIELPTGAAGAASGGAQGGGMAAMASPQMRELRQEMDRLRTLEGRAFDEQFATFQVRAHRQSIDMLTAARANVQDEQVRTLISELLPQLEKHEQQAHGAQTAGSDTQGHGQGKESR